MASPDRPPRSPRTDRRSLFPRIAGALAPWLAALAVSHAVAPVADASEVADAYAKVQQLSRELEILRQYLGKPSNQRPPLPVHNTTARECYYQALTTFQKADKLAFELTATRGVRRDPASDEDAIGNVVLVTQDALRRLERIKQNFDIEESARTHRPDATVDLDDLFALVVQNNRQLNLMLWEPYSPTEVYQRVSEVLSLARILHERSTGGAPPSRPAYAPKMQPIDVYRVLVDAFDIAQRLSDPSGRRPHVELGPTSNEDIVPSDVYDMATLLLAEMTHLYEQAGVMDPPPPSYYPGRRLPSDVHQIGRWVALHLAEIEHAGGLRAASEDATAARGPDP